MRYYSQISVRVPADILDLFLATLTKSVASRWQRDTAGEAATNESPFAAGGRYVIFERLTIKPAVLFFLFQEDVFKMVNLVTTGQGIGYAEHERITKAFWNGGMRQACEALRLEGSFVPMRTVPPEEGLPPEVARALQVFAVSVNKGDGGVADPDDRKLWCSFLALSHLAGAKLEEEALYEYLTSKRFPERATLDLMSQYETAMMLLPLYERLQEKAKAARVQ